MTAGPLAAEREIGEWQRHPAQQCFLKPGEVKK